MSMLGHKLVSHSHSHAITPMMKLRRRQQPRETTRYPRNVLLAVQLEHLDWHLVTVIVLVVIDVAGAGQTLVIVPLYEPLVNAVGQNFTGIYQLQLSTWLLKPNLPQCYVCVSIERINVIVVQLQLVSHADQNRFIHFHTYIQWIRKQLRTLHSKYFKFYFLHLCDVKKK